MVNINTLLKCDMNLLLCFQVLMEEQNVSRAAQRLCLSQSAVSKQLTRLRTWFDDPLFERSARGLLPTPKALFIAPQIQKILVNVEMLNWEKAFTPFESTRSFQLELVETAYNSIYPNIAVEALTQAPKVALKTKTWNEDTFERLLKRDIDFGIGMVEFDERAKLQVHHLPKELECVEVMRDHAVCLMRPEHPASKLDWDLQTFLQFRHIHVITGGVGSWLLFDLLNNKDIQLDVALNVPDLGGAITVCQKSDLLMCYPYSAVKKIIEDGILIAKPIPISLEPGALFLFWHKFFNTDPSHVWLKELIVERCSVLGNVNTE
ncbi:LysR family transcriptional regulator [Vibrio taketomensis]|uniref:LysR family transcriptional regulator n=1 Tax=Vibrio taketomensis TaxID=2572923 RepID=UPI00138A0523|nr:LysR family transcriptional regulator [Vibrio taketomensis]